MKRHDWQLGRGSDKWGGWQMSDWVNGPFIYELTAAGQNNGCSQVWAISLQQVLQIYYLMVRNRK